MLGPIYTLLMTFWVCGDAECHSIYTIGDYGTPYKPGLCEALTKEYAEAHGIVPVAASCVWMKGQTT